jgi:hypothetical protein
MKVPIFFFALEALCILPIAQQLSFSQQTFTIRGTVTDAAAHEPLVAANIRLLGTSKGTISNGLGGYAISVDTGAHVILFSYLGYQAETLSVMVHENQTHDIKLLASPIKIPEIVVFGEDPALEIIRRAITTKHQWMDKLLSYRFEAYTRQVMRRDTSIAGITESYTTGYAKRGDTLREVVRQKRQTLNVPIDENFAAVRRIVNFNDDEIDLFSIRADGNSSSLTFVGPTAPTALENYDYKLLATRRVNGMEIYEIQMKPKSRIKPLLDGTISIANGTFAVMGIDVKPNDVFSIPFLSDLEIRYRQQFSLYDSIFWMPTNIHITGGFSVSIVGISLPHIGIDFLSSIYDYTINAPLPDTIFEKQRLTIDSAAVKFDTTFWKNNEVLPLTTDEQHAYSTLDSTQTLEKQFEPKGPLASLTEKGTNAVLDILDVHFNRVEGVYLGASKSFDHIFPLLQFDGAAGIGLSDHRVAHDFGVTLFSTASHSLGAGAEIYNTVQHVPDEGYYGPLAISLMALLDKNDYRDYYLAHGFRTFLQYRPKPWLSAEMSYIAEHQSSLGIVTNYSIFSRSDDYRPNPEVTEGAYRAFRWNVRLGAPAEPLDLVSRNALEFSIEHTSPAIANSEYNFTQYHAFLTWNIKTFLGELLFPPSLRIAVSGGTTTGSVPPQRMFSLDSRATGLSPFGTLRGSAVKEFQGDRFVMINLEHNFRTIPFLLLNTPFLYKRSIELLTHASFAQTWMGTTPMISHWYSEAGIGISRIFDLFRADLTYRFTHTKRFVFSFGIATLL